jgi:hypothetical protein
MILPTTIQKCMVDGCENPAPPDGRGRLRKFCTDHFRFRWKVPRTRIPKVEQQCLVPGCENPAIPGRYGRTHKCCGEHRRWKELIPRADERPICAKKGCANLAAKDGNGLGLFRKFCETHHRLDHGMKRYTGFRDRFIAKVCVLCGWEGPCDRHRLIAGKEGGKYQKGNVVSLCPNCHRLVHRGYVEKERVITAIKTWGEV